MTPTTRTTDSGHRPMGSLLAAASLVLGPLMIGLALATLPELWDDTLPNYATINDEHDLAMISFNLAAFAFPFLFGSVLAIATSARRSPRLAGWGLGCSMLGLSAMFANALLSLPLALMNGIDDHAGLDELAARLSEPPLVALWAFPLYFVGSLLLGAAAWRSGALPLWAGVCIAVGGLFPVAVVVGIGALAVPVAALRIAGSVPLIKTLARGNRS